MRGGDQTFCVECKQLVSSGCAYALCPVRLEMVAALPAETGGDGHKRGSAADKGHVRTHVEGRF